MAGDKSRRAAPSAQQTIPVRKRRAGGYADATPPRGWDNAVDISEGERLCRDHAWIIAPLTDERLVGAVHNLIHRLREAGISRKVAAKLVVEFAKPPLDAADVRAIAHDVYFEAGLPPGLASRAGQFDPTPEDWPEADPVEEVDPLATAEEIAAGRPVWPAPVEYDVRQHAGKLAAAFYARRREHARLIYCGDQFYSLHNNSVWQEMPDGALESEIYATDPTHGLSPRQISDMVRSLKMAHQTNALPFQWIDEPPGAPRERDLVIFRNGILDARHGDLNPHDGRLFVTALPAYDFDPDAECPTWNRCLGEWLDASYHATLMEFMGYALTADTSYEKMLVLVGVRRSGKSTILRVLSELVGLEHTASRTLNDMGGDFGLEGCLDQRLIVIPDAHDTTISSRSTALDRLKSITGNDAVSINRKNRPILSAHIPARLVIAANRHPKFLDESGALADRELLLEFRHSFRGREDRDLMRKLRRELPGIANAALTALARLRVSGGKFTIGERGREAQRRLESAQSPALRFARDCLRITGDPDDCAPLDAVYEIYRLWRTDEGLGSREYRSRTDFRDDLLAATQARGVFYTRRRWRDPLEFAEGEAPRTRGFFGARIKRKALRAYRISEDDER